MKYIGKCPQHHSIAQVGSQVEVSDLPFNLEFSFLKVTMRHLFETLHSISVGLKGALKATEKLCMVWECPD